MQLFLNRYTLRDIRVNFADALILKPYIPMENEADHVRTSLASASLVNGHRQLAVQMADNCTDFTSYH